MRPLVLLRTVGSQAPMLILVAVGLSVFEALIPLIFRALGEDAAGRFLDAAPEGFRQVLESQFGLIPTHSVTGWLGASSRHPIYLVLLSAVAVAMASGSVAREIERRTIGYILSRPLSRRRFLAEKVAAGLTVLLVLVSLGLGVMIAATHAAGLGRGVDFGPFVWSAANAFVLFAALAGIGTAVSARSSSGGTVVAVASGVALASYFLDFLASLWEPAERLGPLSLFHYYRPSDILLGESTPWSQMAVLAGVALAGFTVAFLIFTRRDLQA